MEAKHLWCYSGGSWNSLFEAEGFEFVVAFMFGKDKKKTIFYVFIRRIHIRGRTRFKQNCNRSLAMALESLLVFLNEYERISKRMELPL
jgi:hypothetical protein